jgi:5-methylcytosine-specific restriction endonuclease McrA
LGENAVRYKSIRSHLKAYSLVAKRTTTINHAFAAAIAPHDDFDEKRVREGLAVLGQDADADLLCAYCGERAETWDHVHATVTETEFSGHGHRLGNLLPCCKPCNSRKGNLDWRAWLRRLDVSEQVRSEREMRIALYVEKYGDIDELAKHLPEYQELLELRRQVREIFRKADALAAVIRQKSKTQ